MDTPDAAAVRAVLAAMNWEERGYPVPVDPDPDLLQPAVDAANAYVAAVTGRPLDATMPDELAPLALQASALRTAQNVVQWDSDYIETANDDGIQSFTVGPYSETRFDRMKTFVKGSFVVNPWKQLNDLLILLMTEDKLDYWFGLLTGIYAPGWQLVEVDWTNGLSDRDVAFSWGLPGYIAPTPD
jgi:hypothetical protein